jgi:hypothetical protein
VDGTLLVPSVILLVLDHDELDIMLSFDTTASRLID